METSVATPLGVFHSCTLHVRTERARQFIDITDDVTGHIARSGVRDGLAIIASQHTTAAVVINEHEPELLKDLDGFLAGLAPIESAYHHNSVPCGPDEVPNGHAHCQALLLPATASIPIVGGKPMLGTYQRVFLVELDHARPRRVTVAIVGTG